MKLKARRQKDSFLLLLAETTAITHRSRYRDCTDLLSNDVRFKNIEDSRLKEEYFKEFVDELEKKELADLAKAREEATQLFDALLASLKAQNEIHWRSTWASSKVDVEELKAALVDVRYRALDEVGLKKRFQAFVDDLEVEHREEERRVKEELKKKVRSCQDAFQKEVLEKLKSDGVVRVDSKWKAVADQLVEAVNADEGSSVQLAYNNLKEVAVKLEGEVDWTPGSSRIFRDCFEEHQDAMKRALKEDKYIVRDALKSSKIKLAHDTSFETFVAHLRDASLQEGNSSLLDLLESRAYHLKTLYADAIEPLVEEFQHSLERRRRREDRFISLLEEYYYRSDHVDVVWEDAKKVLSKHQAYSALERSDRKRLFEEHMADLRSKLAAKKESILARKEQVDVETVPTSAAEEGEEGEVIYSSSSVSTKAKERTISSEAPMEQGRSHRDRSLSGGVARAVGRGKELTLPAWMTATESALGLGSKELTVEEEPIASLSRHETGKRVFAPEDGRSGAEVSEGRRKSSRRR